MELIEPCDPVSLPGKTKAEITVTKNRAKKKNMSVHLYVWTSLRVRCVCVRTYVKICEAQSNPEFFSSVLAGRTDTGAPVEGTEIKAHSDRRSSALCLRTPVAVGNV